MENFKHFIEFLLSNNIPQIVVTGVAALVFAIKFPDVIIRAANTIFENFFVSLKTVESKRTRRQIDELLDEIRNLKQTMEQRFNATSQEVAIHSEATLQSTDPALDQKINMEFDHTPIESPANLQSVLDKKIIDLLRDDTAVFDLNTLLSIRASLGEQTSRDDARFELDQTTERNLRTSLSVRTAMINLFIVFNLVIISNFAVFKIETTDVTKQVILGLYISLATFIIYVYRSSNSRILTLIGIKEAQKHYHDVSDFLHRLPAGKPTTDRDVEIIKTLLVNRSEREKGAEHPYELVLKGVTNSNILLKGGQVSSIEPKKPKEK
ncbi:hypothetical protein ACEN9F_30685 [Duganella sp. CT11-25]|uniref:hypothetical protein n=1 Tax=unclassified Duganella TaxID=2636909 RepID=UPI0039AEE0F7